MVPFAESLGGGFVYDDHALIVEHDAVHSLARLPELLMSEFWQGLSVVHFRYWRPLVATSYSVDWTLYGGRPAGFHATNLVLHGAVALLFYGALLRWTKAPWGALLATLGWAWHPSKVEAVSWIAGRTDLFASLGILIACLGVQQRLSGRIRRGVMVELLGVAIAYASKETAVVAPAFVFAEAWFHFGAHRLGHREILRAARVAVPQAVWAAVYVVLRMIFLPVIPERAGTLSFLDARLYTFESLGEFTRIALFPLPLSIQRAPIRFDAALHVLHDPIRLALGVAAAAAIAVGILAFRNRPSQAFRSVGLLVGGFALLPVSNVLASRMVFLFAERFAYTPLMGFALGAVPKAKPRAASLVAWVAILGASFALSAAHTRHFLDDRHLWEHELAVHPEDPLALRFACEEAMRRHDDRAALNLALRGYQGSAGWPLARPDRVEFAARAARTLELTTLDRDRSTLENVVRFYRAFFDGRGTAHLDALGTPLTVASDGPEARTFREGDPARIATMKLWAAIAASRVLACDLASPMARAYLSTTGDTQGRISAALALARCGAWDEALDVAHGLEADESPSSELGDNIAWARDVDREDHASLEGAVRWSRAQTLLLQRGRAFEALVSWKEQLTIEPEGSLFFARAAWAAGEDADARRALSAHRDAADVTKVLDTWSRELGRDSPR